MHAGGQTGSAPYQVASPYMYAAQPSVMQQPQAFTPAMNTPGISVPGVFNATQQTPMQHTSGALQYVDGDGTAHMLKLEFSDTMAVAPKITARKLR